MLSLIRFQNMDWTMFCQTGAFRGVKSQHKQLLFSPYSIFHGASWLSHTALAIFALSFFLSICIYMHTRVRTYVHVYLYTHVYMYIHVHTQTYLGLSDYCLCSAIHAHVLEGKYAKQYLAFLMHWT